MLKQLIVKLHQERLAILKYLIVGVASAILYLSLFKIFWGIFSLNYGVAISLTYILAVLFHFFANRIFTFKAGGSRLLVHSVKYLTMLVVNYCITMATMFIAIEKLHYSPYVGIILAIMININTNFLISRFWVFQKAATKGV